MILDHDQHHCKKTCSLKEFRVTKSLVLSNGPGSRLSTFTIDFGLPKSTRGFISKTLLKTVKTEQYIISGLQLLGNVGGILGIFVGFSFLSMTEPILTISEKFWKLFCKILRLN